MTTASMPLPLAIFAAPLMTAFRPPQSPPLVRIPIFFITPEHLLKILSLVNEEPEMRQATSYQRNPTPSTTPSRTDL
jgi:hypothetical protein